MSLSLRRDKLVVIFEEIIQNLKIIFLDISYLVVDEKFS